MKRIVVTGTTGYLGGQIAKALELRGHAVVHVNRCKRRTQDKFGRDSTFINALGESGNLRDALLEHGADSVVHAATHFIGKRQLEDLESLLSANLILGVKILEASRGVSGLFINLNSFWQERRDPAGLSPYAASKEAFRKYLELAAGEGVQVENVYIPHTFGPDDHRPKIVPRMMKAALVGDDFELQNPDEEIDLSYGPFLADFLSRIALGETQKFGRVGYVNFAQVPLWQIKDLIYSKAKHLPTHRVAQLSEDLSVRIDSQTQEGSITTVGKLPIDKLRDLLQHVHQGLQINPST